MAAGEQHRLPQILKQAASRRDALGHRPCETDNECAGMDRHVMPHCIESMNGIAEAVVMQSREEFILWPRIVVEDGILVVGPGSADSERTDGVRCNPSLRRREGRQGKCGKGCKSPLLEVPVSATIPRNSAIAWDQKNTRRYANASVEFPAKCVAKGSLWLDAFSRALVVTRCYTTSAITRALNQA